MIQFNSITTNKTLPKPPKTIQDMINLGIITGSILDYQCGKGKIIEYLSLMKPDSIITGYDPSFKPVFPIGQYDTIIWNYGINYIKEEDSITHAIQKIKTKLKDCGKLIIIARSISEVLGNIKRNNNWIKDGNGYYSIKNKIYQQGYDTIELNKLVENNGLTVITSQFNFLSSVPYNYVIATK